MLNQQLKSCARELDVRLNSNEPLQSAFPRARLVALHQNQPRTPNLIHTTSRYISTYGIHLRDADQPIITKPLQPLLPTPFNINGDSNTHLLFTHR